MTISSLHTININTIGIYSHKTYLKNRSNDIEIKNSDSPSFRICLVCFNYHFFMKYNNFYN